MRCVIAPPVVGDALVAASNTRSTIRSNHLGVVLEEVAGPELGNQILHRGIRVRGAICLDRAVAISQQERRDLALRVCGGARRLSPVRLCGSRHVHQSVARLLLEADEPVARRCCGIAVVIPRSLQRLLLHRRVVMLVRTDRVEDRGTSRIANHPT
jgi:hypothetical protein